MQAKEHRGFIYWWQMCDTGCCVANADPADSEIQRYRNSLTAKYGSPQGEMKVHCGEGACGACLSAMLDADGVRPPSRCATFHPAAAQLAAAAGGKNPKP